MKLRNNSILLLFLIITFSALGQSFTELNGPFGGKVTTLRYDGVNNRLYAAVNYKLFRSTDNGVNWSPMTVPTDISQVLDILIDGSKIIIIGGNYISSSTDNGANWTTLPIPSITNNLFYQIVKHPTAGVYVLRGSGQVLVTVDNGLNWKSLVSYETNGLTILNDLQVTSTGDIYLSDSKVGVRKLPSPANPANLALWSESNWVTVFPKQTTDAQSDVINIGIDNANRIFINHGASDGSGKVQLSEDGGATWQPQSATLPSFNSWAVWAPSPNGRMYYIPVGGVAVYEYTAGAATPWVAKPWPTSTVKKQNVFCAVWRSNTQAFAGSLSDGIFATSNTGNSWAVSSNGLKFVNGSDVEITADGKIVVIPGRESSSYWYSTDQGLTWVNKAFAGQILKLYRLPDNTLLILTLNSETFLSTDGINWTKNPPIPSMGILNQILIVATNDIFAFCSEGDVWESFDKGASWTKINITGAPTYRFNYVTRDNDGYFYANNSNCANCVATSYTRFNSNVDPWTSTSFTVNGSVSDVAPVSMFSLNNKIYVVNSNFAASSPGALKVSSDKGTTWTDLGINAGNGGAFPIRLNALSGIIIPKEGYLYITQNDGKTILTITTPQVSTIITDISLNAAGTKYVASADGSPALEFALSSTNKLLLPSNETPAYIDFGWKPVAGGPFGGAVQEIVKNSTGQLFAHHGSEAFANNDKLYRYNSSTSSWEKIVSDWVKSLFIDASDKIYIQKDDIGGPLGLYVSSDNGTTFSFVSDFFSYVSAWVNNDVGHLLAVTSEGILRSTDNGVTFTSVASGDDYKDIVMISDGTLIATKQNNVVRSIDNGTTWTEVSQNFEFITSIAKLDGNKVGLVSGKNIYVSSDGGITWTSVLSNLPALEATSGSFNFVSLSPDNHYYLTVFTTQLSTILYSSSNGGTSWIKKGTINFPVTSLAWDGATLLASTTDILYVTPPIYGAGVLASSDGGVNFSPFQSNKGLVNNKFTGLDIFNSKLFALSNGTLYVSIDNGLNFSVVTSAGSSLSGLLHTPDGALIAYGTDIYKTTDGVTWTLQKAAVNFTLMSVSPNSRYYAYNYSDSKFQSSTDLTTWDDVEVSGLPPGDRPISMASDSRGVLYFVTGDLIFDLSKEQVAYQFSAGTLSKIPLPYTNDRSMKVNFVASGDKMFLYTGRSFDSRGILQTTTDGVQWTSKAIEGGTKFMLTNNYIFIRRDDGDLRLSRDQGVFWQRVGLPSSEGVIFDDVLIDEFTGYAYAQAEGNAILRTSNSVLVNDNRVPLIGSLAPTNLATGVVPTAKLVITFDEAVTPVAGKTIRIVDPTNTSSFVESIDVSAGVQSGRSFTFTPAATTLKYSPSASALQSYYITLEAGSFVDLFANPTNAVINDATWKFTMAVIPDQTAPVITFDNTGTTNYLNIQDNNKAIRATITDAVGVTQSQIYYRPITSVATETVSQLTKTTGNNYEFSVPSSAYGPVGLEFYLTASDAAGNSMRSPMSGYYYAYKAVTTVKPTLASALPAGSVEDNYRMISIPYVSDKTVETVLIPALSQFDAKVWRLLTLNSEKTDWSEYPNDFTTLETGKGYWIINKNGGALALGVESTPIVTKETPTTITLTPGWNQIGNPYPFPMVWSQVLTANNNPAGLTSKPKVYRGGGTGYTEPDVIGVTEGFLVKNTGTTNIALNIPLVSSSSGSRKQQISSTLDESEWRVPLLLIGKSFSNTIGGIGMSPEANESVDGKDDFSAPPLQNMLQLDFPHPEHREKVLARDVVNTQKDYTWNFKVNTNLREEITLQWDNENFGNNSKELFLFDVAKQLPVNMRELTHYSFNPAVSTSFRIYYGENVVSNIEPDLVLLGQAFPNPSEGETTIPLVLPGGIKNSYQVNLDVYNLYGEKIATIYEGEMKGGFHSIKWNTGSAPRGLHLYRLAVSPSTQSVKTQKIILK